MNYTQKIERCANQLRTFNEFYDQFGKVSYVRAYLDAPPAMLREIERHGLTKLYKPKDIKRYKELEPGRETVNLLRRRCANNLIVLCDELLPEANRLDASTTLRRYDDNPWEASTREPVAHLVGFLRRQAQKADAGEPLPEDDALTATTFPPGQFRCPTTGKRYSFRGKLNPQLWKALWQSRGRRYERGDFIGLIERWKEGMISDGTMKDALSDLRKFWIAQGRPDFASRIKNQGGVVWLATEQEIQDQAPKPCRAKLARKKKKNR